MNIAGLILGYKLFQDILSGRTPTKVSPGTTTKPAKPKDYQEYAPVEETGFMSFAQWEKIYAGSYLDYQDWVKGQ